MFLSRPAARTARIALVALVLASITYFLLSYTPRGVGFGPYRIDLDVYRIAGRVWLSGGHLYGHLPPTMHDPRLPFTYPPIAAILLSPLSLVPMAVAGTVLTLGSIALVGVVLRIFLPSPVGLARPAGPPARSLWALAWLLPPALFLEPVRNTLAYGQINVVLMALVCLDCLLDAPRWPRGVLVGLAAALKLTPAAFILFLLLRRDYRAVGTAALSFLAATAAGFLLAWHDSLRYWTNTAFRIDRIGRPDYTANQSIQAVLFRAGLDPRTQAGMAVWAALSIVVLLVAYIGMRRALAASENRVALSLNALAALLISPISWSHHWVWAVPAVLTLADLGRGHHLRLPTATAVSGLLIFAAAPQWWLPSGKNRELHWAIWQQVAGSSYVIFAVFVLLLSAMPSRLFAAPVTAVKGGDPAGSGRGIGGQPTRHEAADPARRCRRSAGNTDSCSAAGSLRNVLLAEDLLLLLTDEASGRLSAPPVQVDIGLGGANLLELTLMNKVGLSGEGDEGKPGRIIVRDAASPGDALLDTALEIVIARQGMKPAAVIRPLSKNLRQALYQRLAVSGVVRAEQGKILGMFPARRWPAQDVSHQAHVRQQVTQALVQQSAPDPRCAALIALMHALRCEHKIVDYRPYDLSKRQLRARATEIANGTWAAEAVRAAIEQIIAAVAASAAAAASGGG